MAQTNQPPQQGKTESTFIKLLPFIAVGVGIIILLKYFSGQLNTILIAGVAAIAIYFYYLSRSKNNALTLEDAEREVIRYCRNHGLQADYSVENILAEQIEPNKIVVHLRDIGQNFIVDAKIGVVGKVFGTTTSVQREFLSNDIQKGFAQGKIGNRYVVPTRPFENDGGA